MGAARESSGVAHAAQQKLTTVFGGVEDEEDVDAPRKRTDKNVSCPSLSRLTSS